MADAVSQQQRYPVQRGGFRQAEGDGQHRRHVGERARPEGDAEDEAEEEGGQVALALHPDLPSPGEGQGDHAEQMQADHEKDGGHEVVAVAADVAQHPPRRGRDRTDRRDGNQDAYGEQRGGPERAAGGDRALLADEADDQRDASQMARAEDDAQDAPGGGGPQRDPRRSFHGMAEVGEELLHAGVVPTFRGIRPGRRRSCPRRWTSPPPAGKRRMSSGRR